MKTIENKKIRVEIADQSWSEYLTMNNGDTVAARCRVLTEAMKKLSAMGNPMEPIPDFKPEYITVERVHGSIHSPGYPVRVQTKYCSTIHNTLQSMYEESHGGGRFAHLNVTVK